ncbi:MAG TPA: polysaccharide deacetylase family protein [Rugosimonospora sp.]|nr:polysaccharide deacetylase family protein [Rugosimonospora sp.]
MRIRRRLSFARPLRRVLALAGLLSVLAACASGTPGTGRRVTAGGGGGGGASASAPADGGNNPFLARVPKFGPAPAPVRITLPTGGPYAPIYHRLPVTQPVAFLTMDDGLVRLPQAIQLMRAAHIPFTMFLIAPVAASDPPFFQQLEATGGVVEDHTITHPILRGKSYAFQHNEICGAIPTLVHTFGRHPEFFRPPYGDYDQTTLKAVHDCGLKAAFYWSETVNDGKVFYQTSLHRISAGDIILMHFRPRFVDDVLAALKAIHDAGLTPALLEDYLV